MLPLSSIRENDVSKTTFKSRYGHYEFLVLSFRLMNSLAVLLFHALDLLLFSLVIF